MLQKQSIYSVATSSQVEQAINNLKEEICSYTKEEISNNKSYYTQLVKKLSYLESSNFVPLNKFGDIDYK